MTIINERKFGLFFILLGVCFVSGMIANGNPNNNTIPLIVFLCAVFPTMYLWYDVFINENDERKKVGEK